METTTERSIDTAKQNFANGGGDGCYAPFREYNHESLFRRNDQPFTLSNPTFIESKTPVTHVVAGAILPIPNEIKEYRYEIEKPVQARFIDSIDEIVTFFEYALDMGLVEPEEVKKILSITPLGRKNQVKACFSLIEKALLGMVDKKGNEDKLREMMAWLKSTSLEELDTWQLDLSLKTQKGDEVCDDFFGENAITFPALVSESYGVELMDFDIINSDFSEDIKLAIIQLLVFCGEISGHGTTLELITDDLIQSMYTGYSDEEILEMEDSEEIKNEYEDYFNSKTLCNKIKTDLKFNVSKKTLEDFHSVISSTANIPQWLIIGSEILKDSYVDGFDFMSNVIPVNGFMPYQYARPISFGFDSESEVLTQVHESIAYGEPVNLLTELNKKTTQFLTYVDLAEKIILITDCLLNEGA